MPRKTTLLFKRFFIFTKILLLILIFLIDIECENEADFGLLLEREANKEATFIKGKILALFCYKCNNGY
jgi:hypothetical protein